MAVEMGDCPCSDWGRSRSQEMILVGPFQLGCGFIIKCH